MVITQPLNQKKYSSTLLITETDIFCQCKSVIQKICLKAQTLNFILLMKRIIKYMYAVTCCQVEMHA